MASPGVNLVGYLNHVIGIGESARQFEGALRAAGVPCAPAALDLGDAAPLLPGARAPWLAGADLPHEVTVLWCNPDRYGIDVDPDTVPGRRLIGRWAWELAQAPPAWGDAASRLCEIWTASRFVCRAVRAVVSVPVRVMPMALEVPPVDTLDRGRFDIPVDRPLFLFVFDHHSSAARKNPLGVIRAFREAFPDGREAALLIKSINAADDPAAAAELRLAAADHDAVRVIDVALTGRERSTLLAGCDCYVSLHRSEGFGMTIAEAMSYARPVIATAYGGSADFLDMSTGYPVPFTLSAVGPKDTVYPPDGVWADPLISAAARLMRHVVASPVEASARGRRAATRIATNHAPAAVGRAAAHELGRVTSSA